MFVFLLYRTNTQRLLMERNIFAQEVYMKSVCSLSWWTCPSDVLIDHVCLTGILCYTSAGLCAVLLNYILHIYVSSGFIGYASTFHQVVADHAIEDVEDDQLYYTKLFLDKQKRVRSTIFVTICDENDQQRLQLLSSKTQPLWHCVA